MYDVDVDCLIGSRTAPCGIRTETSRHNKGLYAEATKLHHPLAPDAHAYGMLHDTSTLASQCIPRIIALSSRTFLAE